MKKSALIPFVFAAISVTAAPAVFAVNNTEESDSPGYQSQRENIDSPEHIRKEYQQHEKNMEDGAKDGHGPNTAPDYDVERRNMDSQEHIQKEYQQHEKAVEDGAKDGHGPNTAPDYDVERRNMDSQEHIKKEYNKTMNKEGGTDE